MTTQQNLSSSATDSASAANKHSDSNGAPSAMLARLAAQAETVAKRSLDAVRESALSARDRATSVGESTVRYVKDEPVKAVLIAAATGAALMGLLSLIQSARRNRL